LKGAIEYHSPTTRWHPKDPEGSPHLENRALLEPFENLYNAALHRYPLAPLGLYALLLPLAAAAALVAWLRLWRQRCAGHAREKLILFMAFNCAYVPLISCLATHGELARYRFLVEGFLWGLAAAGVQEAVARWRLPGV
jgi:hypothetical protein